MHMVQARTNAITFVSYADAVTSRVKYAQMYNRENVLVTAFGASNIGVNSSWLAAIPDLAVLPITDCATVPGMTPTVFRLFFPTPIDSDALGLHTTPLVVCARDDARRLQHS